MNNGRLAWSSVRMMLLFEEDLWSLCEPSGELDFLVDTLRGKSEKWNPTRFDTLSGENGKN